MLVGERLWRLDGPERLLRLVLLHLDVEQRHDNLFANDAAQLLEHHVALAPILDQRVLLGHRAEMHTLAQVVHRLEMLAPPRIDHLEDHEPLDLAHQLRPEAGLAIGVGVEGVLAELLHERLTRKVDLFAQLSDGDVAAVQRGHLGDETVEIPVLGSIPVGRVEDILADDVLDPLADLLGGVLAVEHVAALFVNHHALRVHHVVVLEDVLAGDEVLLLHLLLGALDLARED